MSMTTQTIAIRNIYVTEGMTKKNQPYKLTKLYSTKREYFSTFKSDLPKLAEVREGSAVTLEYSDDDRPGNFKIIKILSVENRQSLAEQGKIKQVVIGQYNPQPDPALPTTQAWLREAIAEIKAVLQDSEPTADSPIVAALVAAKATVWSVGVIHRDTMLKLGR